MSNMETQIVRGKIEKAELKKIAEKERRKRILERWQTFSLTEQLGNIGAEVSRACHWQGKDEKLFRHSVERVLELFDFTLEDPRWRFAMGHGESASPLNQGGRLYEIARAREVFCNATSGGKEYTISLKDLNRYFLFFACVARKNVL